MILSRVWTVLLAVAVAVALYVVYVAVGQYNRQNTLALKEGLASDSQTAEWALKIDARRRLDALLVGSVDPALQQALVAANAAGSSREGKLPDRAKGDAKKALGTINESIPADWREDALFAVDRDGQMVAQLGYDIVAGNDDFELGGYPAVNDALHGFLRDDVWALGSRMYVVVARPVEYDASQRPAGAIVGLKEINKKFAEDLAKRTRTSIDFFVSGKSVASGVGVEGLDPERLDTLSNDLKDVTDKTFGDGGRSDGRMLSDDFGVMYARLPGDVWALGGGFAVVRAKTGLASPFGFLSNADDKDKANVPWLLLAVVVLGASLIGVGFTFLEHSMPLGELVMQADRLKAGAMEHLQVARFRGAYRLAAQSINEGIERAIEKAGGMTRKPADLESILGPVPAQPAMAAFSFPNDDPPPAFLPTAPLTPAPPPPSGPGAQLSAIPALGPRAAQSVVTRATTPLAHVPTLLGSAGVPAAVPPKLPPPSRPNPPVARPPLLQSATDDEDATMVGAVPADLLAQATGERVGSEETAEWLSVYDDFLRTKRQCGEPMDGLTFEKFSQTLRKNRDQLIARHGCKRVKFSVYIKEGRASLKATPVKD